MIKEEMIEVTPTGKQVGYYKDLGYNAVGRKPLLVNAMHIPKSSMVMVTCVCVDCGTERKKKRSKYRPRCQKCAGIQNGLNRKDESKTTCPECGSTKSYSADTCRDCVDMSGENNPMFGKPSHFTEMNRNKKPEEHWNWKGGVSKDRSGKVIDWARKVKEVGNCDICGFNDPLALDAHHLHSYERGNPENFNIDNGVCLCKNHHAIFHKNYGFGDNTEQQYLEFKEGYNG